MNKYMENLKQELEKNYKFDKRITKEEGKIYMGLLKFMDDGNKYYKRLVKEGKVKKRLKTLLIDGLYKVNYQLASGEFLPDKIKIDIENKLTHILSYNAVIGRYKISIEFGIIDDNDINNLERFDEYAEYIFSWIYVCGIYAKKSCVETLKVQLYLTEHKKELPENKTKILGPTEINTGYTYRCAINSEIVLYRKEEWKKVFIHETMHTFGLDMSTHDKLIKKTLHKHFPIKSKFLLSEAYVEYWGRILNVIMSSYYKEGIHSKKILSQIKHGLELEKYYSLYQASKVLDYMGLQYEDIICNSEKNRCVRQNLYREKTNVFSYYILTSILLHDYKSILIWCKENNENILRFLSTKYTLSGLIKLIIKQSRNKKYRTDIYKSLMLQRQNDINLRMSIID